MLQVAKECTFTSPIDVHLGFRAYHWIPRYKRVAELVKERLIRGGFGVNHFRLYKGVGVKKPEDKGIVISWSIVQPV